MFKVTEKSIKSFLDKYYSIFGENMPPLDYIIIDKKYRIDDTKAPASMIGPIDGEYGLYLNVRDYILDDEKIVIPIILHELVHYKLLLDGVQYKEEIHDENFQTLAEKIEQITGIEGVKYGKSYVHEFLKYRNKTFFPLIIENENGKFITRIDRNSKNYWKKYLTKGVEIGQFKSFKIPSPTNRRIFEDIPLTKGTDSLDCVPYDEEIFYLNF